MRYLPPSPSRPPSLLRKTGAIIATTVAAGVALMFSAVLLVVLLCVGAVAFGYLWWKMREVRKQMRELQPRAAAMEQEVFRGEVIEGEVIRVEAPEDRLR